MISTGGHNQTTGSRSTSSFIKMAPTSTGLVLVVLVLQLSGAQGAAVPKQCKATGKATAAPAKKVIIPAKPKIIEEKIDLLFLIDKSKEVTEARFKNEQNFMLEVMKLLKIGPKNSQVGLVEFWSEAFPMFTLNEYDNFADLKEMITQASGCEGCTGGKGAKLATSIVDAVQSEMTVAKGMRADALKFVVIVTNEAPADEKEIQKVLPLLKKIKKLKIIVCGVGGKVNEKNVGYLASSGSMALFYKDFGVLEKEGPKEVTDLMRPSSLKAPIDLAVLVDVAAPGESKDEEEARTFLRGVIDEFVVDKTNVRVAFVTYGEKVELQWDFNKYTDNLKVDKALADFKCTNCKKATPDVSEALEFVRRSVFVKSTGSRLGSEKIVMVLTNGQTKDQAKLEASAKLLVDSIHGVAAVGVGKDIKPKLEKIASDKDLVYVAENFEGLQGKAEIVAEKIYKHALEPLPKCNKKIDIEFMLDKSGSLSETQYNAEREYVKDLADQLDIGPTKVRVALTMFGNDNYPQWGFSNFTTTKQLVDHVAKMTCVGPKGGKCLGFKTKTSEALTYAATEMANAKDGARADAKKVVVVLTDGHSTDLKSKFDKASTELKKKYHVMAIGVGDISKDAKGKEELNKLATSPEYVDVVPKFEDLPYISRFTAMRICSAAA